jgi:DNA-binding transcriptional ArsR family regulator
MATQLDAAWDALADPTRRRIVELLVREPMRAGAVADAFPVAAPTISRHLRVLRKAGLIEETRVDDDARVKLYRLRREPFGDLGAWLDQVQAFWRDQLEAFAAEVARQADSGAHPDAGTTHEGKAR